jgi:hypothetical protein
MSSILIIRLVVENIPVFIKKEERHLNMRVIIVLISLLMSPLLGHRPSLWITYKENGP